LDADRKSLLTLGYFRRVAAFEQSIGSQVLVTFRLAEWPQVAHIRITGNTAVDLSSLHATVGTRLGQVLSTRQLAADIAAIEKVYRARGFVARVSERIVDEATSSGILRFEIIELRIGAVEVEAPLPGLAERCRRVLQETPPRLYQPAAVAEDQARLLNLPHVRSAEPVVESLSEGNRPGTAAMSEPGKVKIRWRVNSGESRSGREGLRAGG
jgi:hemolysin activation/secretion protein